MLYFFIGGINMLKKSFYTIIQNFDSETLIYNTKNGIQVVLPKDDEELKSDLNILNIGTECDLIKNDIIKKAFCVEENIDEFDVIMTNYYKQMFDPTNLSFIIMPNNICNFKCIYCYQNHDEKIFSEETICNFINAIKDYNETVGIKKFYAEWFGGEPFMTYDILVRITDELSSYFEKNKISYHFGATTNGSLLSDKRIKYLLDHKFDYFQITLDGNEETHNKTRPFMNGKGTWKSICSNLKKMHERSEHDFHVAIRVNYNNETFEKITDLFEFIKNELDDRFSVFFHTIGKWGGKQDDLFDVIEPALEPYTTVMLMEQAVEYGIEPRTNYDFYNPFRRVCYASMPYHFTVGSDGKLRKCNEEDDKTDEFNIVGTIENGKIEIDLQKWSKFVLPGGSSSISQKCKECVYFPICFSQNCPKMRVLTGEDSCPHDLSVMAEVLMNKYRFKYNLSSENKEKN